MQTFLPYSDFRASMMSLDRVRLNKQRIETKQILTALERGPGAGWYNHPATRMWRGYEGALAMYGLVSCVEWLRRGYNDKANLLGWFCHKIKPGSEMPPWLGYEPLHASHRANLLRKLPGHYGLFGWTEEPTTGYFWPTHHPELFTTAA